MEEVHRQQCQECGNRSMRNIIYRNHGETVFVQCRKCHSFVARYKLVPGGYYHHGKGYESFLRSITRTEEFPSGKNIKHKFEKIQNVCLEGFNHVLRLLHHEQKEDDE